MKNNQNVLGFIICMVLLLGCDNNKTRQTEQVICDGQDPYEQSKPDAFAPSVLDDVPKTEDNSSIPISSSSTSALRLHKSGGYNNMRGFDPASEDDMDDNGMERYMENNDDEGWD